MTSLENFKRKLKDQIYNSNRYDYEDGYYEWKIKNWNAISSKENSAYFLAGGHKWFISLKNNKYSLNSNNNYISVFLNSVDSKNNNSTHICVKYKFFIRNYYNYDCYKSVGGTNFEYFNKENTEHGYTDFINKNELYTWRSGTYLVRNNMTVIGVYIRVYKYNRDDYLKDIKSLINNNGYNVIDGNYYEWNIDYWPDNYLYNNNKTSPDFSLCKYKWRIQVTQNRYGNISIILKNVDVENNEFNHVYAKCVLVVRNYNDYSYFMTEEEKNIKFVYFDKNNNSYNMNKTIFDLSYHDNDKDKKAILENNKMTIGVYIRLYKYEKDNFIEKIKELINDDDLKVLKEDYYEWSPSSLLYNSNINSSEFTICNYKWKLQIVNNYNDKLLIKLKNINSENDKYTHIYAKCVLYLRNTYDYSYFYTENKDDIKFIYFNENNNVYRINKYINHSDLRKSNNTLPYKSSLEGNALVVGAYIRIYEYEKEKYINDIKKIIKNDGHKIFREDYHEFLINNWTNFNIDGTSHEFIICNYKWKLQIFNNYISNVLITLKNIDVENNKCIHIYAKYVLTIRNYNDYSYYYIEDEEEIKFNQFDKDNSSFTIKIKKKDLLEKNYYSSKSLIENDKAVVGVYIRIYNYEKENYIENVKKLLKNDDNLITEKEGYHEKKIIYIPNDNLFNNESFIFEICNYKWKINVTQKTNHKIMIKLKNLDVDNNKFIHIYGQCILVIRNYKDYSYFYIENEDDKKFIHFDENENSFKMSISKYDLIKKDGYYSLRSLSEDNKMVIGVYLRIYKYKEDQFRDSIKKMINNNNNKILYNGFYEWKIENWNQYSDSYISPEFNIENTKWKIRLYPNIETDEDNYVSIYLYNTNDRSTHIIAKFILYLRDYYNYSYFFSSSDSNLDYFNNNNNNWGWKKFIKSELLNNKNDKIIVGAYICIYKYEKENYEKEIKSIIKNDNNEVLNERYYEWMIDNWNLFINGEYSPEFKIGNYNWKLQLYPKDYFGYTLLNLKCCSIENNPTIHVYAKFISIIRNYNDYSCFYTNNEINHNFDYLNNICSSFFIIPYNNLLSVKNLYEKSLIENDKAIIGAYIQIYKYGKDQYMKSLERLFNIINKKYYKKEDYYEWRIEDWKNTLEGNCDHIFESCNQKWKIELTNNSNGSILIRIKNEDVEEDDFIHIYAKAVLTICNYNDYSCFYTEKSSNFFVDYNKNNKVSGWENYLKEDNLFNFNNSSQLIENNKAIISAYIRTYNIDDCYFKETLREMINNDGHSKINDGYYEYKIEDWENTSNQSISHKFILNDHQWEIQLILNNKDNDYISIYLKSIDVENDSRKHLYIKSLLILRNYYDNSYYYTNGENDFDYYNKNNNLRKWNKFIEKEKLIRKGKFNKSLIEDNKMIVGIFICEYEYGKDQYIENLKDIVYSTKNNEIINENYYEWKINDWNNFISSEDDHEFVMDDQKWKIQLKLNEENNDSISITLKNENDENDDFFHICNKYLFTLRSCNDYSYYYTNEVSPYNYYNKFNKSARFDNSFNVKDIITANQNNDKSIINNNEVIAGIYICNYKPEKEQYLEELNLLIKDNSHNKINDGYYEWIIDDLENIENNGLSKEFRIADHNWSIHLNLNNNNENNEYISFELKNKDIESNELIHIYSKCLLTIRDYNNYSNFYTKGESNYIFYDKYNNLFRWKDFIKKEDLSNNDISKKPLIESNKFVVGIYIRTYEFTYDQYIEEIESYIKDEDKESINDNYYEWDIENLENLSNEIVSHEFSINNLRWKIQLNPNITNNNDNDNDYISACLKSEDAEQNISTHIYAKSLLILRNHNNYSYYHIKESNIRYYNKYDNSYTWKQFIKKKDIFESGDNLGRSLVENNKVTLGIYIRFYRYDKDQYIEELKGLIRNNNLHEIIDNKYYEWEIENWNEESSEILDKEFNTGENNWNIQLYSKECNDDNNKNENYISYRLENYNVENNNKNHHICTKYLIIVRHPDDYSNFYINNDSKQYYYNNNKSIYQMDKFIKKDDLFEINKCNNKSDIENNKLIIGAYINTFKYDKDKYNDELKSLINDEGHKIINEGHFEWKIENWDELLNDEFSNEFEIGNNKWKLLLNPNGYDSKADDGYISIYLKNLDAKNNIGTHTFAKCLISFRNYKDYSNFFTKGESKFDYYNNFNDTCQWEEFIKGIDLFESNISSNKSIIEDNKIIIDTYIRIYEYEKEQYLDELKKSINNEGHEVINEGYYEWPIEDWFKLQNKEISEEFTINNSKWKIHLYTNNKDENSYVSLYLQNMDSENSVSTHIKAKFILTLRNNENYSCFHTNGESKINYYNKYNNMDGWKYFIRNKDLFKQNENSNVSIIEDGKVVIGAYIRIFKYEEDHYIEELKSLIKEDHSEIIDEVYHEWKINKWNELINNEFKKEFIIGNNKWEFTLNPNGFDDKADNNYISVYLNKINDNTNDENGIEKFKHLCTKTLITLRNCNDYSCFYTKPESGFNYFNKNNNTVEWKNFINKNELYIKNETCNNSIIENNEVIVGIYHCLFEYKKEHYIEEINKLLLNDNHCNIHENCYFEWKIENIEDLNNIVKYSPEFEYNGHKWELQFYSNGNNNDNQNYISIYLRNKDVTNDISSHINAKCIISIHNPNDYSCLYTNEDINYYEYNQYNNYNGWEKLIRRDDFYNKIVEDGKCTISTYIQSYIYNKDHFMEEIKKLINNKAISNNIIEEKYYEFEIDNWNNIPNNEVLSPEFEDRFNKWQIQLNPTNKDLISIKLKPFSIKGNCIDYYTDSVLFIRRYNDYSYYIANPVNNNNTNNELIIKRKNLMFNDETSNDSKKKSNKVIIGAYILYRDKPYSINKSIIYSSSSNYYRNNEWKELHIVCKNGDVKRLNQLIYSYIDLSEKTNDGWSALPIACHYGHLDIVKILIEKGSQKGIDINSIVNGMSCIEIACNNKHYSIVNYLLDKGANINLNTINEYKLLHCATKYNNLELVKILLEKGHINVNVKDSKGWTALHLAVCYDYYSLANYLLRDGNADVNEIDQQQNTPLHICCQYGHIAMAQLLINHGAYIDYRNQDGWTPLHIACSYGYEKLVQILLDNNANIELTTFTYWSPLHISVYYNKISVTKFLLSKIKSISMIYEKNDKDQSVFDIAEIMNYEETLLLLNQYVIKEKTKENENFKFCNSLINQQIINLLNDQFHYSFKN